MKTTLTIAAALSTRAAARRPGPGPGACHREVLRHRQGRQERLPDRDLVLRRHVQEGRRRRDAWLSVPKGTCEKIVGGSLDLVQELIRPSAAALRQPKPALPRPVQPAFAGPAAEPTGGIRHDVRSLSNNRLTT